MILGTPRQRRRRGAFTGFTSFLSSPKMLPNLAAWYDVSDLGSMVYDASNRVQLVSDKSGNSAENALCLNGLTGNGATAPDIAAYDFAGDMDLRADVSFTTFSQEQFLITKWTESGNQRSYFFRLAATGALQLVISSNGSTTAVTATATAMIGTVTSVYSRIQVRAVLDADDGAGNNVVTFYTKSTGDLNSDTGWSVLGLPITTVGTVSVFQGTSLLYLGRYSSGTGTVSVNGNYFRALMRNEVAQTVFYADFSTAPKLATSFTESSSNAATVTINTTGDFGARISGPRDLYRGTVANQPILLRWDGVNYGWLNGVAGNFFSTPDSAAVSVTGDIDLRAQVSLADVTPAASSPIISKWDTTGSQRSYLLSWFTDGRLRMETSETGASATKSAFSTLAVPVSDYGTIWVRCVVDVDNGASGASFFFYTSSDGVTWTQLGNTVVSAGVTSIFDSTAQLQLGGNTSTGNYLNGNIYRAQIYNGINGTLAFDFNPATYTGGMTLLDSSSNAATITLNGGSVIVQRNCLYFDGSNDVMKAAAFALTQPETVYFVGAPVTWTNFDCLYDGGGSLNMTLTQQGTSANVNLVTDGGSTYVAPLQFPLDVTALHTAEFDGPSSSSRLNRGALSMGNPGTQAGNGFTLGGRGNGSNTSNIITSEVAICLASYNLSFWNLFALYVQRKWGIRV